MATYLVFGATGGTGKHFVSFALGEGHRVKALVRNPAKLTVHSNELAVEHGSITDSAVDLDKLLEGVDSVVSMLGDREAQRLGKINTAFVKRLVPAMRRQGVKRFLYQAGGLSTPYQGHLTAVLWAIRHTVARGFEGQHRDNEAVMAYLAEEARDIEWMVHRAGIGGDGPSKGTLQRSPTKFSVGTHRDCAVYNYRTLKETAAIHTSDFSHYVKS